MRCPLSGISDPLGEAGYGAVEPATRKPARHCNRHFCVGAHRIAQFGASCGESVLHRFGYFIRRDSFVGNGVQDAAQALHGLSVESLHLGLEAVDVFICGRLSFLPNGSLDDPGFDSASEDLLCRELAAEAVGDRLKRVFGRAVRSDQRLTDFARHGTHIDDAPKMPMDFLPSPQQGKKGLSHGDLSEEIDLKLMANLGQGQRFKGPTDSDASVVDQAEEAVFAGCGFNLGARFCNGVEVRDIEVDGNCISRTGKQPP